MDNRLEKFRTRWYRWLSQKTRCDESYWVTLLDCNWSGWALRVLEKHNVGIEEFLWTEMYEWAGSGCYQATREKIRAYYSLAIKHADMEDLHALDNLYCTDIIERRGL